MNTEPKFKEKFGDLRTIVVCVYCNIDGNIVSKVLDEMGQEYDIEWRNK
jgi:hypothetical protein